MTTIMAKNIITPDWKTTLLEIKDRWLNLEKQIINSEIKKVLINPETEEALIDEKDWKDIKNFYISFIGNLRGKMVYSDCIF